MRRLLSKAVGRGGGEDRKTTTESTNAVVDIAAADGSSKSMLTKAATKHSRRRKGRGVAGCITGQPESSPSPEPKRNPAVFLEATSQFVGLTFDPFR
jgi:hypothetical protein